jgi:5-hydroxyisourate hydrolase
VSVSTHVLDAATGRPAEAVPVTLSRRTDEGWAVLAETLTDADGRVRDLPAETPPGVYRLRFDSEAHQGPAAFYPEVVVTFRITDAGAHHHVPLLLSPFAYSTYRGS